MKPQRTPSDSLSSPKEFPLKDLTGKIISCAIAVHSILGPGLLEVYMKKPCPVNLNSEGISLKDKRRYS